MDDTYIYEISYKNHTYIVAANSEQDAIETATSYSNCDNPSSIGVKISCLGDVSSGREILTSYPKHSPDSIKNKINELAQPENFTDSEYVKNKIYETFSHHTTTETLQNFAEWLTGTKLHRTL